MLSSLGGGKHDSKRHVPKTMLSRRGGQARLQKTCHQNHVIRLGEASMAPKEVSPKGCYPGQGGRGASTTPKDMTPKRCCPGPLDIMRCNIHSYPSSKDDIIYVTAITASRDRHNYPGSMDNIIHVTFISVSRGGLHKPLHKPTCGRFSLLLFSIFLGTRDQKDTVTYGMI
jgi:hypothetical protein